MGTVDIVVDEKPTTVLARFNGDYRSREGKLREMNMIVGGFLLKGKPYDFKFPFEIPEGLVFDTDAFDRKRSAHQWVMTDTKQS